MAVFIPSTPVNVPRSIRRHVMPVLRAFDDRFCFDSPLNNDGWRPDLVLERRDDGRTVLFSVVDAGKADIFDPAPMTRYRQEFRRMIKGYHDFIKAASLSRPVRLFIVMWKTDAADEQLHCLRNKPNIVICPRSLFIKNGRALLDKVLETAPKDFSPYLKRSFFPETEIPAECTTRQLPVRETAIKNPGFFLNYDQELAAKMDLFGEQHSQSLAGDFGVRLINGVAGSGKTLILITRVGVLAQQRPSETALFLVHNKPVSEYIDNRTTVLTGLAANGRVHISTFWSWCLRQWHASGLNPRKTTALFQDDAIKQMPSFPASRLSKEQLLDEFVFIDDHLIDTREQYLNVQRMGRGFALQAGERSSVWDLYERFNQKLDNQNQVMASRVVKKLCRIKGAVRIKQYDHILIDEAQFFAPSWFELVKKSLKPKAQLFLCADPNQGFLRHRLSWQQAGLGVRGRTRRLKHSYRTTRQILTVADYILNNNVSEDRSDFLRPDLSAMSEGDPPLLIYRDAPQDCIDVVAHEISAIVKQGTIPPHQLLVLYTRDINGNDLFRRVKASAAPHPVHHFVGQKRGGGHGHGWPADAVKVCLLNRATGLEAGVVFLLDTGSIYFADRKMTLTDEEKRITRETSLRKLYMAMTRAGQKLVLLSTARLPVDVEALMQLEA